MPTCNLLIQDAESMIIISHLYLHPKLFFQSPRVNRQLFPQHPELNPSELLVILPSSLLLFLFLCSLLQRRTWSSTRFPKFHSWHHPQILLLSLPTSNESMFSTDLPY